MCNEAVGGIKKGKNMQQKFQEKLMDIQEGLLSLCLEATKGEVDKIFAYASIEEKSRMFNAFFEKNGEILSLHQLGINFKICVKLLDLGISDLREIKKASEEYGIPYPREIKMWYDVRSGKFNADYRYEEVCSAKTGVAAEDVFMTWMKDEKENVGSI